LGNYILWPETIDKIQETGIISQFPELLDRSHLGYVFDDDILRELKEVSDFIWIDVTLRVEKLLSWEEKWFWSVSSSWEEEFQIEVKNEHIALAVWLEIPYEVGFDFLDDFEKYGFNSKLDFLMTVCAYRWREVLWFKWKQYHWINSQGIRNVITTADHHDPEIMQFDENSRKVISPFWNQVGFIPRNYEWGMIFCQEAELSMFATFFRYAIETWQIEEIFWNKWQFILDKFGERKDFKGADRSTEKFMFGQTLNTPIPAIDWEKPIWHAIKNDKFFISDNWNLELRKFEYKEGSIVVGEKIFLTFFPEDVKYLIEGMVEIALKSSTFRTNSEVFREVIEKYFLEQK